MTRKQKSYSVSVKSWNPISIHQKQSFLKVTQVVLFLCRKKYHRLWCKNSPPQQSTLTSTMVDPAQKTHRPSRGQAIHLPNHATIMIKPCWSGIVKKWKEKICFSIRKLLTSWHNAINAKNTLKTYFFWPTQRFRMPQSTAYAFIFLLLMKAQKNGKKELFLIELVMFLCEKMTARKTSKNDNQTYLQTSKQSAVTAQQAENFLQPAIKRYKKERKC